MQLFDAIVTGLPTALVVVSPLGEVVHSNDLAEVLLGKGLEGRSCREVLGLDVRDMAPGSQRLESSVGDQQLGLSINWIEHDGDRYGLVVFREISQIVELRKDRERLLQLAAVGATMPSILHEVRNPLAAVQTGVELLIEEVDDASVSADLFSILGELRYVTQTLQGFGTIGQSLKSSRYEAVDFAIEEATRLMVPTANRSGVQIEIAVAAMPLLKVDSAVVRGLVVNLVNNSIHACSGGDTITVRSWLADHSLWVSVKDTGSGMSEATLKRCTELFYSSKRSGSGIGLALVVETVHTAGGTVEIKSALGKGTTVVLRIPSQIERRSHVESR